ncbi:N-6 DNA Methylase, partial [Popillia japonica]
SDWGGDLLRKDGRWQYGVPPVGNANFAWLQHFIYHLSPNGQAGVVLAKSEQLNMSGDIRKRGQNIFEQIKKIDDNGNEFWSARDMAKVLEYSEYRHFLPVIERAKEACANSKKIDDNGNEFWSARDMAKVLEYSEYRHFLPVIERAKEACANSGFQVTDHFEDILEMVSIGSGAELGGTMPENLPTADSIKKLESEKKKMEKITRKLPKK